MISKDSEVTPYKTDRMATYFLDRNLRFFDFIVDYVCDPLNFSKILPSNKQVLRQLHVEATHYRVTGLVEILEKQGRSSIREKWKKLWDEHLVCWYIMYFLIPGLFKIFELLSVMLLHVCFTETEHCYQLWYLSTCIAYPIMFDYWAFLIDRMHYYLLNYIVHC